MTAGRRARARGVAIGFAAFIIFMHAIAYFVVGPSATATPDKHTMITITATLLLAWLLMISQAMESMTRAFYARADLDLILASPTAAHKLFAIRISTVALTVAAMALPLAGPFIDMLILRGGIRWLGAYGVIIAMGTAAAALAVAMTVALFRAIGPKRTRLVAQVVAAVIGAAFVIGLQVAAILSYGTLVAGERVAVRRRCLRSRPMPAAFSGGRRAPCSAKPCPLAGVLIFSFVLLAVAVALVAPRFGEYAVAAAGAENAPASRAQRRTIFRITSPRRALRRKEWILLRRDPWLVSQTLMQMLYLVPPAILLWRSFQAGGGARQSAGAGAGDGGGPAVRRPRLAHHLRRGRARSRRHRAGARGLHPARQDRGGARHHRARSSRRWSRCSRSSRRGTRSSPARASSLPQRQRPQFSSGSAPRPSEANSAAARSPRASRRLPRRSPRSAGPPPPRSPPSVSGSPSRRRSYARAARRRALSEPAEARLTIPPREAGRGTARWRGGRGVGRVARKR